VTVDLIGNGLVCFSALVSFIYAAVCFFRPETETYQKMIAGALGCCFICRLYEIVQFLVAEELPRIFQVGTLGGIGCFMFLMAAFIGTMDGFVDDGSKVFKKYRWKAVFFTLVYDLAAVLILISPASASFRISNAVEQVLIGGAAFFSFKHLIIPKELAKGAVKFKPFYLVVLLFSLGNMLEIVIWAYDPPGVVVWIIPYLIVLLTLPALALTFRWGVKRWKM